MFNKGHIFILQEISPIIYSLYKYGQDIHNTILHYTHTLCEKTSKTEISVVKAQKAKQEIRNKFK